MATRANSQKAKVMAVLARMPLSDRDDQKAISLALGKAGLKKINYGTIYNARNALKQEHNILALPIQSEEKLPGIFDILIFKQQVDAIGIKHAKEIITNIEKISK